MAALLIPGLLQTADYARAMYSAGFLSANDEEAEQLVAARLARQRIFDRPNPPKSGVSWSARRR